MKTIPENPTVDYTQKHAQAREFLASKGIHEVKPVYTRAFVSHEGKLRPALKLVRKGA